MARRSARLDIVVDAQGPDALIEPLGLVCSLLLGLDLRFALAVGGLGLLEDADNVLALRTMSAGLSGGLLLALTLLTTFPDLLITVMVSPTPIAAVGRRACTSRGSGVVRPDCWVWCGT
jgi:hypothetical protein